MAKKKPVHQTTTLSLNALYPYVAAWVTGGWIEIGESDYSDSFVRAGDQGGMVYEGNPSPKYRNLDGALGALNEGIKKWCKEVGIDFGIEDE
jgi:hypothetical protein